MYPANPSSDLTLLDLTQKIFNAWTKFFPGNETCGIEIVGPLMASTVNERTLIWWPQKNGSSFGLGALDTPLGFGESPEAALDEWIAQFFKDFGHHLSLTRCEPILLLSQWVVDKLERTHKPFIFDVAVAVFLKTEDVKLVKGLPSIASARFGAVETDLRR